jgi:hypothetical protein
MSSAKQKELTPATENLTADQWAKKIEEYDVALTGPPLEPAIRSAIEKLRENAVQQKFLTEFTTPVQAESPAPQFVTPAVPEVMPSTVVESLAVFDAKIASAENSLAHNPPFHFVGAYRELLADAKAGRERVLYSFTHPEPIPVPLAPPPVVLPPEVVELIAAQVKAQMPEVVAHVICWLQNNKEWLRS